MKLIKINEPDFEELEKHKEEIIKKAEELKKEIRKLKISVKTLFEVYDDGSTI